MKQFILPLLLLYCCLMGGCQTRQNTNDDQAISTDSIRYAQGVTIQRYADYTVAEVSDPWDRTKLLQRYILVGRNHPIPDHLPDGTVVRVPIRNIVVYTSVHAGIIDLLGGADQLVGACESKYIDSPNVKKRIQAGYITDLGNATSPNVEKMLEIGTEVVIASPFQNNNYGSVEKTGIPIIEGADYMESLPLGRAEWVRFYGLLLGREEVADSLFAETEARYIALKEVAASVTHRPTVISEKCYGSTWHVPAGDSYIAHLYQDAGADYLYKDLPGAGSVPYAFESVFEKGIHADFWFVKYYAEKEMTYNDLRAEYEPYQYFDAFKRKNVYGCNTEKVPYYEEFPIHPDYLLKDLIGIFHPELIPDYTPRYFKQVTE